MDINLLALASGNLCEMAKDRWHRLLMVRLFWAGAILTVAAVLITTIAIAVLTSLNGEDLLAKGAIGVIVSVTEGGVLAWMVARQKDAAADEESAYADMQDQCGSSAPERRRGLRALLKGRAG